MQKRKSTDITAMLLCHHISSVIYVDEPIGAAVKLSNGFERYRSSSQKLHSSLGLDTPFGKLRHNVSSSIYDSYYICAIICHNFYLGNWANSRTNIQALYK